MYLRKLNSKLRITMSSRVKSNRVDWISEVLETWKVSQQKI